MTPTADPDSQPSGQPRSLAACLRRQLAPALSGAEVPLETLVALDEALALVRAGVAMSRSEAPWLQALERDCARLQAKLAPALRARELADDLNHPRLPRPLRRGAEALHAPLRERAELAERELAAWWCGAKGQRRRAAIDKALKRGAKRGKPVCDDSLLDDYLASAEARSQRSEDALASRPRWKTLRAHARALRQLALARQLVRALGQPLDEGGLAAERARCDDALRARRACLWLREQLETAPLDVESSAAAGALWQALERRSRAPLAAEPAANDSAAKTPRRARPALPLQMHFAMAPAAANG